MKLKMFAKKGFTLIEIMVAMSIFVIFTGILINSYSNIVRSQRQANDYRVMYSEARDVFETLTSQLRDGMVDYQKEDILTGGQDEIWIVSKDATAKTHIRWEDGVLESCTGELGVNQRIGEEIECPGDLQPMHSDEVQIEKFRIYVSPVIDPYDADFVFFDRNQFHPKVTIYAEFVKELSNGEKFSMDLQTSISSRIYNQVYEKAI